MSGTMHPTVIVDCVRRLCAMASGTYPSAFMTSVTRARTAGRTASALLITRETVVRDTFAPFATSRMVVRVEGGASFCRSVGRGILLRLDGLPCEVGFVLISGAR